MPASLFTRNEYERLARKHVTVANQWNSPGTDYWVTFPFLSVGSTLDTDAGWVRTTVDTVTQGDASKLISKVTPGTPGAYNLDASGEAITSPPIFGDYLNGHLAADLLGRQVLPRFLAMDAWGAWSVNSTNEAIAAFGFTESGTTGATSADHLGAFTSDSTNWNLDVEGVLVASTIAVDTSYHWWRLVWDVSALICRAYVDGVLAATSAALQPEASWPAAWFASMGTNRPNIGSVHVFYAWNNPGTGLPMF